VVIAKGDKAVVRFVAIPQGQFMLGVLEHDALGSGPDFFSPMDADEPGGLERARLTEASRAPAEARAAS
jgi:hypothetical protein